MPLLWLLWLSYVHHDALHHRGNAGWIPWTKRRRSRPSVARRFERMRRSVPRRR